MIVHLSKTKRKVEYINSSSYRKLFKILDSSKFCLTPTIRPSSARHGWGSKNYKNGLVIPSDLQTAFQLRHGDSFILL